MGSNEIVCPFALEDARVEVPPWLRDFSEAQDLRAQVPLLEVSRRLTSNLGLEDGLRWDRSMVLGADAVSTRASILRESLKKREFSLCWRRA